MIKPIIERNSINMNHLFLFIYNKKDIYSKTILWVILIFIIYFFIKTPSYSSQISFYATYKDKQESSLINPLAGLMGLNSGSLDFSISDYIKSDKLLQKVVEKEYIIDNEKLTLIDYWGGDYNNFFELNPLSIISKINKLTIINPDISDSEKRSYIAKQHLKDKIEFSEDRISSLYTISIEISKYPSLSKQIIDEIYSGVISYTNEIGNSKAVEKINFIDKRLIEVKNDLQNAENDKLIFLENNKNITSPSLILKKDRIERKIILHSNVYTNLLNQLEIAKINQQDNTTSIFVLDESKISSSKSGETLLGELIKVIIICFLIVFCVLVLKNRSQLINAERG